MSKNKDYYCVIMAGGIGSRFWPMSTNSHPKQFIDMLGVGKSLLQMTFERMNELCPAENIYVVTNASYKNIVMQQLQEINENQILLEPFRKNTAPCIAYALHKINKINPNSQLIICPSDHLILNQNKYINILEEALNKTIIDDCIVTMGIKPTRPDTGYGYIQFENNNTSKSNVRKVKLFTEKPQLEIAKTFLESQDFYWNSGIFISSAISLFKLYDKHLNELNQLFHTINDDINTLNEQESINKIYSSCVDISIDYGIMEKANNVYVILSDFGWSDLGTWGSLYEHLDKDDNNNAILSKKTSLYETKNCIIRMPKNKTTVIQGAEDMIIVENENVLLICKKDQEQRIKQFVNDINLQ